VMTVRLLQGPNSGFRDFDSARLFRDYEQGLFTKVVSVAERDGRHVKLLVVPSTNPSDAITQTAVRLRSTEIVVGESGKFSGAQMSQMLGEAWDRIEKNDNVRARLTVCRRDGGTEAYQLGAHAPHLSPEDIELIHRLWLDAVSKYGLDVHHGDVVRTALEDLAGGMTADDRQRAVERVGSHLLRRRLGRTETDDAADAADADTAAGAPAPADPAAPPAPTDPVSN